MGFGSLGGRFTTVEGLLEEVSGQVCGCGLSGCANVWSGQVCVCKCVGVGVSVCRCVGVSAGVWVCLHMCSVWGDSNHILYMALTFFYSPFHSPSLPHTTSSFHVYCSSSLFIHLHLVIVHLTTQRCRDLSISSKRWKLTTLNVLRVFHTSHHTHTHALCEIRSDMSPS